MFCPECGLQNRAGAKFCTSCGARLGSKGKKPGALSAPAAPAIQAPAVSAPSAAPSFSLPPTSGILPVGTVLDRRYRIVEHVATGGMGAIYKGEDTRLKTTVAIKEMLDFFQKKEDKDYAEQRFREEALMLADLRHPNIPRVTDNFIGNGRYYLIMDFVEGKSSEKLLQENAGRGLTTDRVIKWAIQICDVLEYLHMHNPPIIYRDMKPSNIMVKNNDSIMIVDFGIARHFTPRRPGTMIGTHGYAPPEQYKGNTEPRSDLYALAATLHHLITGNDPTLGVPFTFAPIRKYRPDADKRLEKVLEKALQNQVSERYKTAAEMKSAFMAIAGAAPSQAAYTPPPVYSQPKPQQLPPSPQPQPQRYNISKDIRDMFMRAKEFASDGRFKSAKRELEKVIQTNPDIPEVHTLMGYVLTRLGRTTKAIEHLNRAIKLTPGSATAHLYLGKAYDRAGNNYEAQKEYRTAYKIDPELYKKHNKSFLEILIETLFS